MLSETTKGLKRTALYLSIGLMMVSAPALAGERPGVVTAASVNLRESATTDSASLHVLQKNTTLTVLGQEGDFYYVLDNGTYGYVAAQYVSLTEVTNHTGIVNVKSVNMRKGAGYDYTIVKVLHEGDKVAVNGETGDFYFVSLASGVTGYVHKDYLNITAKTVKDDPLPEEVGLYGYVTAKTVNLRSSSSLTASIIQKLKQDSEVYVIARYNDFYYVQYRDTYGYIYADYITYQVPDGIADDTLHPESVAVNWTGKVNTDGLNVRSGPSKSSTKLASLSKGDRVTIVETSGDFYKVKYAAGKTGYVMAVYVDVVSKSSAGTVPTDNYANATNVVALGDAPGYLQLGDSGSDVKKLQQALKLNGYFNDTVDGIFGATTQNALQSYQSKKKLTVTGKADYATIMSLFGKVSETTVADDPLMRGITKISEITVPATSKKGDTGDNVLALQQALKIKGYFTAPIQDTFGTATQTAVLAYQKASKLTQTGEADAATIRSLFNANAANHAYITSQLYWQDGDSTIPKKAVFTVKDCQTGLTFRCSRWSGYNHLEAEPLTAEDTAVMQKIYKSWSWARRPILVLYNGSVYAASMNGMPQEGYNIQNNNFDGHFCIHFTGSKTHGTKVVDSQHRNCVQQALKYKW